MKQYEKEEALRVKRLNKSMVTVSKKTQNSMGIVSVQPEHGVFYLSSMKYVKIYTLKFAANYPAAKFVTDLMGIVSNRFRVTNCWQKKSATNEPAQELYFFSLFVKALSYADAYDQFQRLEEKIMESASDEVLIEACSLSHSLMYMQLSSNSPMEIVDLKKLIKSKADWGEKIFPCLQAHRECMSNSSNDLWIYTFLCKEYPEHVSGLKKDLLTIGCDMRIVIDVQAITDEQRDLMIHAMEQKYNIVWNMEKPMVANGMFMIAITTQKYENLQSLRLKLLAILKKHKLIVNKNEAQQYLLYRNICSMGIVDFHSMRNVSVELVKELVM